MQLNFTAYGDGHPLILIHGFLGALDNWRTMSKRLATRFRVYAIDLRNHGHSPHRAVMNFAVMARDVREFLDQQKVLSAFVLGHSLGGKVAMQTALEFPARIDKLIVADIAPKAYAPSQRGLIEALRQLNVSALRTYADADTELAPAITGRALRQFLIKNLERSDSAFRWRIPLDILTANYEELIKAISSDKTFDKPVCFLRGEHSNYLDESDLAQIRELFPRAELRTIANSGHWLHIDAPDAFFRNISAFLDAP
ncbi:MAG TPA: alpha/beta fold hydrolase [Terriglobales bacterium]|jgi:pimeloyl-ACP methyl ester carboxylesterase|nr:alpha/beta fold hydrolase [Terriglobales bacterium]